MVSHKLNVALDAPEAASKEDCSIYMGEKVDSHACKRFATNVSHFGLSSRHCANLQPT